MPIKLPRKLPKLSDNEAPEPHQAVPTPTELLTIKAAAAFAVVSAITVRRWLKAGFLRSYRAGRQIRIDKAELISFLSQ